MVNLLKLGDSLMKKITRLLRRHKRLLAQCALFTPLAFFSGLNFITPLLLILGVLLINGLRALYGNDPYVQENSDKRIEQTNFPMKSIWHPIDPDNLYLGYGSLPARKRHLGF